MIETTTIITLVLILTEIFKKAFKIPTRFAPLLSLALGLSLVFLFGESTFADQVFTGIVVGLSASGLYSGTKATIRNK